eukprot:213123-Rhodomonas_salina.1
MGKQIRLQMWSVSREPSCKSRVESTDGFSIVTELSSERSHHTVWIVKDVDPPRVAVLDRPVKLL